MRFLMPEAFWLLLPWLALLPLWRFFEKRAEAKLSRFADLELMKRLVRESAHSKRKMKFFLGWTALFFAVVALARPQMGTREEYTQSQGLDLVFLLDVSNSMLTEDIVPSRIKKAKHVIKNFVDRLSGDRAGVIAFAGSAYPAVPLTTDYDYIRQTLDLLDEKVINNQGTDLFKALNVAMQLLERGGLNSAESEAATETSEGDSASSVIVIVSDGESHEGEEGKLVATLKKRGIKVFTIGVGNLKGGPIPMRDDVGYMRGYRRDLSGNMILSKLEPKALESIASKTGGKYYSASSNEGEVEEILNEISSLERTAGGGRRVLVYEELFQYPLVLAVFLLLIQVFLREASRVSAALILLALFGATRAHATSLREYRENRDGMKAYQVEDYTEALRHFGSAQADSPESLVHRMNLGDAFLKSGSPDQAQREFEEVIKSKDPNQSAKGSYNMGKAFEAEKKHEDALRAYQAGLDRLAKDPKADPEIILRLKRAMEVAQQRKQQSSQDQDGKDGQGDPKSQKDDKKDTPRPVSNPKPKFKAEKLSEDDAKRVLKQLQEQEKQTQQRVMRMKNQKPEDEKTGKDW